MERGPVAEQQSENVTQPGAAWTWRAPVFILAGLAAATPWSNAPLALAGGIVLALLGATAFPSQGRKLSRWLIQGCIVLLGLRIDLGTLLSAAREGLALAVATIVGALAIGLLLGRLFRTDRETSVLVSSGTAICGGSAIVAVGAAIGASSSSMAIATGAVFVLNAVALFVFPPVGHALGLTDTQFGAWAGVAIHDMSSVAGAASDYGGEALTTANVVKLTRVLWILPVTLAASWWMGKAGAAHAPESGGGPAATPPAKAGRASAPWFILWFVVASCARSLASRSDWWTAEFAHRTDGLIRQAAAVGFQGALFLIGAGLSLAALRAVGWRALVQATLLWLLLAGATLLVVRSGS